MRRLLGKEVIINSLGPRSKARLPQVSGELIRGSGKLRDFYGKDEAMTKKPGLEELFKGHFLSGI